MKVQRIDTAEFLVIDDEQRQHRVFAASLNGVQWVFWNGHVWEIEADAGPRRRQRHEHENLAAPMPATVVKIPVEVGQAVRKGDTVLVLEAMKMELPLRAAHDGSVVAIRCAEGELVQPDVTLIEIE
jgi:3-methylcrotonyl-CoA carboxylase alpha subunit